jgi:hypothetical protein
VVVAKRCFDRTGGSLATVIFGSLASNSRFSAIFAAAAIVCLPLGVAATLALRPRARVIQGDRRFYVRASQGGGVNDAFA